MWRDNMQTGQILRFRAIEELQISLQQYLDELKKQSEEYSKLIGEKIRGDQYVNPEELADLKTKLEGQSDPKKKKQVKSRSNINTQIIINNLQYKGRLFMIYTCSRSDKRIARSKQIDLPTIYSSGFTIGILGR